MNLRVGDLLRSHDGRWVAVEDLLETGEYETVHTVRVSEYHTYFVGCAEWGFSVWAHNADCARFQWMGNQWAVFDRDGKEVSRAATKEDALKAARGKIPEDDFFAFDVERQLHAKMKPEGYLADPDRHLKKLGKDALGKGYPGKTIGGGPTHAYHIVLQQGSGVEGKAAAEESQEILSNVIENCPPDVAFKSQTSGEQHSSGRSRGCVVDRGGQSRRRTHRLRPLRAQLRTLAKGAGFQVEFAGSC